jgi:UDP-N-acetylmuramoyl-tripeptide--D-alanyl-D-alanine ligase
MITNIGPRHIENLGSLKNIAKAKAEIMEGMYKGGTLFIPEDVSCREVFESKAKQYNINLRYFSLEKSKYLKILSETSEGFQIEIAGVKADWKHPGKKLLENMSGVLEVLAFSNISIEESAKKIIEYKAALSRNVMISGKFHIIDDCYNANPDSIKSSIDSLKQVSGQNRTIAILGDMKELGKFSKKFHLEIGEYCKNNNINALIGFGNDAKFYLTTYKKGNANYERAITFTCENYSESINKIIHILKTNLKENDFVLVKGSRSMKMERIVDELKKLQE